MAFKRDVTCHDGTYCLPVQGKILYCQYYYPVEWIPTASDGSPAITTVYLKLMFFAFVLAKQKANKCPPCPTQLHLLKIPFYMICTDF